METGKKGGEAKGAGPAEAPWRAAEAQEEYLSCRRSLLRGAGPKPQARLPSLEHQS